MRPDGKGGQVKNKIATNAFFCARDMACMELEFPKVQKKHIYMGNLTFRNLTPAHKKFFEVEGILGCNNSQQETKSCLPVKLS